MQPPNSFIGDAFDRVSKKTRQRQKETPNANDPIIDDTDRSVHSMDNHTTSWKDMLLGNIGDDNSFKKDEDLILGDEDAAVKVVNGIPFIMFSDRVHKFIAQRMFRTIMVKLLGRKISYHVMSTKLQSIWRT